MYISTNKIRLFVLLFFFLSGICGLIYQIVWMRLITLIMGNTIFAVSTVLTAFMGGLALGSYIAGRLIDRHQAYLKIYGVLEGIIGIYCLILPWIINIVQPIYIFLYQNFYISFYWFSILRFFICAIILVIPTTLMGATLPVLSKFYVDRYTTLGWNIGRLYAINTFGAVLGAFCTGFIFVPSLGVYATLYSAAIANLVIAIAVISLVKYSKPVETLVPVTTTQNTIAATTPDNSIAEYQPRLVSLVLWGFGISGFAALMYEVAWTRVLSLIVGPSIYAFSLMLTAFILGLAIGSFVFAKLSDRIKNLLLGFSGLEILIGISVLAIVPIFGKLPLFIVNIIQNYAESFFTFQLIEFSIFFLLMLIPTTLMGGTFPIVCKIYSKNIERLGRNIGTLYCFNTVGAVLGSFFAGFIFIPWIGIQNSLIFAVLINVGLGVLLLFCSTFPKIKKVGITLASVCIVFIILFWSGEWDKELLSSGAYLYGINYQGKDYLHTILKRGELLFYKEGITTTVSVTKKANTLLLSVDGKVDASNTVDMNTQKLLAHIPLSLHPSPEHVLVIGLGSGITLGAVAQHPAKNIDCVEISPCVVQASYFFNKENYNVLNDNRVNLIIGDGRNHLLLTDKQYDVIIAQASSPWMAGMSNLFTYEYFTLAKSKLRENGIMCQWFQGYGAINYDFRMVIHTYISVFTHTTIWYTSWGDILLVGFKERIDIDPVRINRKMEDERINSDLQKINIFDTFSLLSLYIMGGDDVRNYAKDTDIHTDGNPILEFSAPKNIYRSTVDENIKDLYSFRCSEPTPLDKFITEIGQPSYKNYYNLGMFFYRDEKIDWAIKSFQNAINLNPLHSDSYYQLAMCYYGEGITPSDTLIELLEKAIELDPYHPFAWISLAKLYCKLNDYTHAIQTCKNALQLLPENAELYTMLGYSYLRLNDHTNAYENFCKAIELNPEDALTHEYLGAYYTTQQHWQLAVNEFKRSIELNPYNSTVYINLGSLYFKLGEYDNAITQYQHAIELTPENTFIHNQLGLAFAKKEMYKEALRQWRISLEINPEDQIAREYIDNIPK